MSEEQENYGDQPAAVIDPPRTIRALSEKGLVNYQAWGWVKMSAKFIAHIRKLKGAKLGVWQVIALSIDETGKCRKTIKEICELTDYSHTEVINSIRELQELGYLTVQKDPKGNIYDPEFVARGELSPSDDVVKKLDSTPVYQVESTPAIEKSPSSIKSIKRVNMPKGDLVDLEISKLPAISIRKAISDYFKLNTNWETKYNRQWMEWAVETGITAEQIARAADIWRTDKQFNWQVPTLKGIFEKWQMLIEAAPVVETTKREEGKGFYA